MGVDSNTRGLLLVVLVVCCCGTIPAMATAQTDSRAGGTIVVSEGETVDDLEAAGGTVVVEGTVTGDVSVVAGTVRIAGDVGGDLEVVGGGVTIDGDVAGDVEAAAGSVAITDGGSVGGTLSAGAGSVTIDGTVDSDAAVGAETIRLGEDAAIAGDLTYGGTLEGNTEAVAGELQQESVLGSDLGPTAQPIASWLFSAYVLAVNLVLGAALLAVAPRFSTGVADRVATDPVRTGLVGLGVLVGVPILLAAVAITIVGIPLSIVGGFAYGLAIWIGIIYGRYAVAAWLLSAAGLENRWLALVVGLVAGALVAQIPYVGGVVNLVVLLLGLGALARGIYVRHRSVRERTRELRSGMGPDEPAMD